MSPSRQTQPRRSALAPRRPPRLLLCAQHPFLPHLPRNLFMRNPLTSCVVGAATLYGLEYVEVIKHIVQTAVVGEILEDLLYLLFRRHARPPAAGSNYTTLDGIWHSLMLSVDRELDSPERTVGLVEQL